VKDHFDKVKTKGYGRTSFLVFPTLIAFIFAGTNYFGTTFAVYMKYQAMVDAYNEEMRKKKEESVS